MNKIITKNIITVIGVLFFQLMVLSRLNISQSIYPLVYPILLFTVVRNMNRSIFLLFGFGLGFFVDIFSNTGGAHAFACTVIAFVRPLFLSSMGPMDIGSDQIKPSILSLGVKTFAVYALFMLAIHHVIYFILEVFTFHNFHQTIFRIFLSLLISWLLVMSLQFLFNVKRR
ncbi:MAG: rod shape-determining protein MreD [Flavobacteriales bacterium]|nr:rod shape-determining protein MreD [Flavobacteriales bacterium]